MVDFSSRDFADSAVLRRYHIFDCKDFRVSSNFSRDAVEFWRSVGPLRIRVASNPEIVMSPAPLLGRPPKLSLKSVFIFDPAARCRFLFLFSLICNTHSRRFSPKRRRYFKHMTDVFDPTLQINSIQHAFYEIHTLFSSQHPKKSNIPFSFRISLEPFSCSPWVAPSIAAGDVVHEVTRSISLVRAGFSFGFKAANLRSRSPSAVGPSANSIIALSDSHQIVAKRSRPYWRSVRVEKVYLALRASGRR